ncbi:MAG: YbhB/YbcL family Raf kinase inhibitor-like protein [Planctomycetes bacterium]|nr:YbhB/YbcL family Raf kinase inhibitor-like protein [Planctomycetota bacterium]
MAAAMVCRRPEGVSDAEKLSDPAGALQGKNDFGEIGYGGSMPPPTSPAHRYVFTLYALDAQLDLKGGLTKAQLLDAIKGHILAQAKLTGTYKR